MTRCCRDLVTKPNVMGDTHHVVYSMAQSGHVTSSPSSRDPLTDYVITLVT